VEIGAGEPLLLIAPRGFVKKVVLRCTPAVEADRRRAVQLVHDHFVREMPIVWMHGSWKKKAGGSS
jgi:hypothetical protein